MTWIVPLPPEVDGPTTGPPRALLEGYLDFQRRTFQNVCAGLTAEQLAAVPLPSGLSLLGLMHHLAKVERIWFRIRGAGEDVPSLYPLGTSEDFDDRDPTGAQAALATWQEEVRLAQQVADGLDLDHEVVFRDQTWSLGFVLIHVTAEYCRHNGHADLIREALDGVTGR